ncbi:sushi, von Willebrand factor type A, EGF and pentraxin domain-containing protein 1-like [Oscarella lobularis]|uniref:sushi, von Willebrand factor type A, EGF and pentraxin domain-containing protein 1-like n=1 Tax=Oscarella lobularis TaxID=121494 RepID=UPI0033143010
MSIGDEFYDLLKPLLSSPSDVVFLIDASASVSLPHFKAELHIVDAVLFSFDVSRDGNRVAVVTYSTDVHPDHWNSIANPSLTKCDLRQRLHNIPYIPGWRNTGVGLVRAGQILGSSSRSGVNRVVITLTDGQASHGPDVATSAADVISLGATLFALGFGGIGVAGLQVAASSSRHVFFIGEPGNLDPFSSTLLRDLTSGQKDVVPSSLCFSGCPNGQCTCGRVSAVYQCSCNDGYSIGGSGLCEACPLGRYRGIGDRNCKKCINHATTQSTASTSISDCVCENGYEGLASVECTPVTCPDPGLSSNGKIAGDCQKTYTGAPCKVGCSEGYKLTTAEFITCQADKRWSGLPQTCAIQQCSPLIIPQHAENVICTDGDNYKSTCTMHCKLGYRQIKGSQERTCQSSLAWDGEPLQCEQVTCPPLPVPENGALTPPDCSSVNQIYNAVCRYNCIPGYSLTLSISEVTCRETGKWSYEGNFECKDTTPPSFTRCQEDFVVETFPDHAVALYVFWFGLRDEVEDSSGEKPTVSVDPQDAEDQFREWTIGSHRVTYSAADSAGNIGRCSFQVTVIDKQPPKIEFCPRKKRKLVGNDGKRKVEWNEPKFTDNSGLDLVITKSHESGSLFELGRHLVTYVAKDSSGNEVTCRFSIIIVAFLCEPYSSPQSGFLACKEIRAGSQDCEVRCKEGYRLPKRQRHYFCRGGRWYQAGSRKVMLLPTCRRVTITT